MERKYAGKKRENALARMIHFDKQFMAKRYLSSSEIICIFIDMTYEGAAVTMWLSRLSAIMGKAIVAILQFLGLRNVIIIELEQGKTENTEAVFLEMLQRGLNEKYRFAIVSQAPQLLAHWNSKRITVYKRPEYGEGLKAHLPLIIKKLRAVLIIEENYQIRKGMSEATQVFLSHGSPVKSTHDFYNCREDTDFSLCQSEFWRPIESYQLKISPEKLIIKGFPRNDELFSSQVSLTKLFGKEYKKSVVLYPTYRKHKTCGHGRGTESAALPIIHDEAAAKRINEIAAKYGVLLVVKPHPVQDLSRIKALDLDHLKVITGDYLIERGITDHAFLAKTDAMITDYSSIVFDYLLTGKPIALAQEDYEEYEKKVGFAIDMNLLRSCSVKLETAEDFEPFFRDLVAGNDPLREKRDELMHLTNYYTDGNSTKRVVDWLETLLKK